MIILELNKVNTGYGNKQILYDFSIKIIESEISLIIGSNGSGKSTLLNLIYGLLPIWRIKNKNSGNILFKGTRINDQEPFKRINSGMVYIPQKNELFEDLSVLENLEISGLSTYGIKRFDERLEAIQKKFKFLNNKFSQKIYNLSGGERKLLSIAMGLMNNPDLILIDEPLSGLSLNNIQMVLNIFQELKRNGLTLIIVEHRIKELFKIADKVIGIKLGKNIANSIETINQAREVIL